MKKKELGIFAILVIAISIMIFSMTRSIIEENNNNSIIANIESTKKVLKENDTIEVSIKLKIQDNLLDKVNLFHAKLNYDKSIFNEVTIDDFNIENSWSNLEYNKETQEFIILNLNKLKNEEDILTIILKTKENIPSVENTSISIANMESANWQTKEIISITNEKGNTIEETILTKEKKEDDTPIITVPETSTTTKLNTTSKTTTTSSTSTSTTTKGITTSKTTTSSPTSTTTKKTTTTTSKSTTKKQEVIIIPPTTSKTTKKEITTTTKNIKTTKKKTTTDKTKKTTSKKTTKETTESSTTKETTTKKEEKSFFEKNNNANKKVFIIFLLVIILLVIFALYKYKHLNILAILLISQLLLTSVLALNNLGDIDNDGKITIKDITNLERYLLNIENIITDDNKTLVDLDEDNDLTTIDLALLIHSMLEATKEESNNDNGPTAYEVIKGIQIGWNLGNTLDSTNYQKQYLGEEKNIEYYETLWGNPITTKEMIDKVKEAGFNSIRIPVTYYDHLSNDGKIDAAWLKRVETVVNYCLDNDLYCIMDVHHDTGLYEGGSWIVADAGKFEENAEKVKILWTQIADYFKDYDYKLIFEGLNETVDSNRQGYDWNTGTEITLNVIKLNQVFVDTVRASGGKNKHRVLAVTTYGGITDEHKLSNFTLPNDTVKDKIILAVHDYAEEEQNIDKMLERLNKFIVTKNIPIMIDEFGTKADKSEERRAEIASYYVKNAKKFGIPCFWWDDGGNYQLFDRRNLTWKYERIKEALITSSR